MWDSLSFAFLLLGWYSEDCVFWWHDFMTATACKAASKKNNVFFFRQTIENQRIFFWGLLGQKWVELFNKWQDPAASLYWMWRFRTQRFLTCAQDHCLSYKRRSPSWYSPSNRAKLLSLPGACVPPSLPSTCWRRTFEMNLSGASCA